MGALTDAPSERSQTGVGGTHVNPLAEAMCWVKQPSLMRCE